jgi:ion channel-forming bestrophin family protein
MHVGRSYKFVEFAFWSRRSILYMIVVSAIAVAVYSFPGIAGFSVPWPVIIVLGTTVALVAGLKNSNVFGRSTEALQAFAQISASSRMWAAFCKDFCDAATARTLIYRHIAWMTALRFALRRPMPWETMARRANLEYRRRYRILEDTTSLAPELTALLGDEAQAVLAAPLPAIRLLEMQVSHVNALLTDAKIPTQVYSELQKIMRDLHDQQARCDRIKNNPYPRQYAIVSSMFVMIFCTLLPFGAAPVFAQMNSMGGVLGAVAIWLTIPFSTLVGWMYMSLDQVGESTSNPFEGNANDVPISQICRGLEIELRTALGETNLPPPLLPVNGIAT